MSSIEALPSEVFPQFDVTWSGQDETNGSGVASFIIYVSEDGRAFSEWLTTTNTSALFAGTCGHSYRFYSVARDNVGNTETTPAASEAMTMVVSDPLRIVNFETRPDGSLYFRWIGEPAGLTNAVEYSPTLSPAARTNISGSITDSAWTNGPPASTNQGSYRVRVN